VTRLRVVCVGNALRGDDGAGPAVAERLRELAPGLDVVVESGEPAALLDALDGADEVILVDAVRSGAPAGSIQRVDVDIQRNHLISNDFSTASTHGLGVAEALELARALGRLPAAVTVYGIEGRDFTLGAPLSAAVARAARRVARACTAHYAPASRGTDA
jgi:hydrogenase maturation protease